MGHQPHTSYSSLQESIVWTMPEMDRLAPWLLWSGANRAGRVTDAELAMPAITRVPSSPASVSIFANRASLSAHRA